MNVFNIPIRALHAESFDFAVLDAIRKAPLSKVKSLSQPSLRPILYSFPWSSWVARKTEPCIAVAGSRTLFFASYESLLQYFHDTISRGNTRSATNIKRDGLQRKSPSATLLTPHRKTRDHVISLTNFKLFLLCLSFVQLHQQLPVNLLSYIRYSIINKIQPQDMLRFSAMTLSVCCSETGARGFVFDIVQPSDTRRTILRHLADSLLPKAGIFSHQLMACLSFR